jgi:hypothetical protein
LRAGIRDPYSSIRIAYRNDARIPVHFSDATITDSPYFFHFTSSGEKEMITKPGQKRLTLDFSVMNYDGENRTITSWMVQWTTGNKTKTVTWLFITFPRANILCW